MENIFKSERHLLQGIIDKDGDCVSAAWCLMCPFSDDCISRAITHARLLPQEERVQRAYNKLFDELMENELEEDRDES